jgi:hypothetical protein
MDRSKHRRVLEHDGNPTKRERDLSNEVNLCNGVATAWQSGVAQTCHRTPRRKRGIGGAWKISMIPESRIEVMNRAARRRPNRQARCLPYIPVHAVAGRKLPGISAFVSKIVCMVFAVETKETKLETRWFPRLEGPSLLAESKMRGNERSFL